MLPSCGGPFPLPNIPLLPFRRNRLVICRLLNCPFYISYCTPCFLFVSDVLHFRKAANLSIARFDSDSPSSDSCITRNALRYHSVFVASTVIARLHYSYFSPITGKFTTTWRLNLGWKIAPLLPLKLSCSLRRERREL